MTGCKSRRTSQCSQAQVPTLAVARVPSAILEGERQEPRQLCAWSWALHRRVRKELAQAKTVKESVKLFIVPAVKGAKPNRDFSHRLTGCLVLTCRVGSSAGFEAEAMYA